MNIERYFWPELGIFLYRANLQEGEKVHVTPPVIGFTFDSPTITVVAAGSIWGDNPYRDRMYWSALPQRTEDGIMFPGLHTVCATEDNTVYACVCQLPPKDTEVTPDMFRLDHDYLDAGLASAYSYSDGYRAVIVMSGAVDASGESYAPGSKILVPVDGTLGVEASEAAHLVGYRDTNA